MLFECLMVDGQGDWSNDDQEPIREVEEDCPHDGPRTSKESVQSAQDRRPWKILGEAYIQQWMQKAE